MGHVRYVWVQIYQSVQSGVIIIVMMCIAVVQRSDVHRHDSAGQLRLAPLHARLARRPSLLRQRTRRHRRSVL